MREIVTFVMLSTLVLFSNSSFAQPISAVFNTPAFDGDRTTTLEDKVIEIINLAKPGSNIHIGMYDFDRVPLSIALLQANARGVNVRIVFDHDVKKLAKKDGSAANILFKGYEPLQLPKLSCTTSECIKFCQVLITSKGSCRGIINNHNKFIIFSELNNGIKNVVAVSSANWTAGQLNNYNDLVIFNDDAKLYANTLNYWNGLRSSKVKVPLILEGDLAQIYTFPNHKFDPVLDLLNRVTCQIPGSKVRVLQSRFTNSRSKIAQRLVQLAHDGCDVSVITRNEPDMDSPGTKIRKILGGLMGVLKYRLPNGDGLSSIHSKLVLIDASVDNSTAKEKIVLAGSHNLNGSSLTRNDELLAQIEDTEIYAKYFNFWNRVHSDAVAADMFLP
jgi:phosphatidylserine/phosphatidylglycerophosphate/cardiolipin synthase-like enzyme